MKIGILGGGQLARMLIEGCYKYGFEFSVLSIEKNSSAGQITKSELVGDWNDEECLKKFSNVIEVITLENEFIDFEKLQFLESLGKKVYPCSKIVRLIQDKLEQKRTLCKIGIPVAKFAEINSKDDVTKFTEANNYPVVLKSRTMGYDGKGNFPIQSSEDIEKAFTTLTERGKLMCERFVKFDKEIATQVVRNKSGEIKVYPVVETIQKEHICNLVLASKDSFGNIKNKVKEIAMKIVSELNYVGVMGIEMFMCGDEILVNELAPRVHNSGHYTIEGSYTSQFENHIRAILNFPLGNIGMTSENSVMINILGERNGDANLVGVSEVLERDKVYMHIYGKMETRIGRKMGHITVLKSNLTDAIETAYKCRESLEI